MIRSSPYFFTLNILKILNHRKFDTNHRILMAQCKVFIRSKIDYDSIIYRPASPSKFCMLNTLHHTGIRIALVAYITNLLLPYQLLMENHILNFNVKYLSQLFYNPQYENLTSDPTTEKNHTPLAYCRFCEDLASINHEPNILENNTSKLIGNSIY